MGYKIKLVICLNVANRNMCTPNEQIFFSLLSKVTFRLDSDFVSSLEPRIEFLLDYLNINPVGETAFVSL